MTAEDWELRRSLRIELLRISDEIQDISLRVRSFGCDGETAVALNNLQIKIGELIGSLWK